MTKREASARNTDPDTSHLAAAKDPAARERDRDRAWQILQNADDGLTDFELAERLGRQQTSAGKRRGELRDAGLVRNSGKKRPAPSGSAAIVWEAIPAWEREPPSTSPDLRQASLFQS